MKRLYHFLGSVYFALLLIGLTAFMVILGTWIESKTSSHLYAAKFTYGSPFFLALLAGFFINILISALRRYPFKLRHIPFLITHFGLLMILSGVMVKYLIGTQGVLLVWEGSGSQKLLIPHTEALYLESRFPNRFYSFPLNKLPKGLEVISYNPHADEFFKGWIKKTQSFFFGTKPFPLISWKKNDPLPKASKWENWNLIALQTDDSEEAIREVYMQNTQAVLTKTGDGKELKRLSLREVELNLEGDTPYLLYTNIYVPLSGPHALFNENRSSFSVGAPSQTLDLQSVPTLLFLEDSNGNNVVAGFDSHGMFWKDFFDLHKLERILSYDQGYQGYGIQARVLHSLKRSKAEKKWLKQLTKDLRQNLDSDSSLSPPLKLLKECLDQKGIDFPTYCIEFLNEWDKEGGWLFWKDQKLDLKWGKEEKKAAIWAALLFEDIEPSLQQGFDLIEVLKLKKWPLIHTLQKGEKIQELLHLVTRQIFSIGENLPDFPGHSFSDTTLLSAYLRLYDIHLKTIAPFSQTIQESFIECPLCIEYVPKPSLLKLEDNRPSILLKTPKETVPLGYDPQGTSLKWPILEGKFLARFQPSVKEIPYRIRLQQARQILYPESGQPVSYEADLLIQDLKKGKVVEKTVSMNVVHETWDGYRFYLSSIAPKESGSAHQIQLIVNHDPAKYLLTYPGAAILSLGVILLFWIWPYKKKRGEDE